jgi:hypothetical protein
MAYRLIDPEERLDFQHDWNDFLGSGDSIVSRQWLVGPINETSPESPILTNATGAAVMIEGCLSGRVYHLTERITTAVGLRADRTIVLRCETQ